MTKKSKPDIIAIVGKSNSGKTTLMEKLISQLTEKGFKVGSVKHAHEGFEMDRKGKDSWRHKQAGAFATLVLYAQKAALIKDDPRSHVEKIDDYLNDMDIVLVEGMKTSDFSKIEIFRTDAGHKTPAVIDDPNLIAFVTDNVSFQVDVPVFELDNVAGIVAFIENRHLNL